MKISSVLKAAIFAAAVAGLGGCIVTAVEPVGDPYATVYVSSAPPAPRAEYRTSAPGADYIWADGHWAWRRGSWVWVSGRWERQRVDFVWVAPHYEFQYGKHVYIEGGWVAKSQYRGGYSSGNPSGGGYSGGSSGNSGGYKAADPNPGYKAAEPGYKAAEPGYKAAEPGYKAAEPGYKAAEPGYKAAEPGYKAAEPGYKAAPEKHEEKGGYKSGSSDKCEKGYTWSDGKCVKKGY